MKPIEQMSNVEQKRLYFLNHASKRNRYKKIFTGKK
jgi:hypothetical protein